MPAQYQPLPDGRLHLQHGPIDIVIGGEGEADALISAHAAAWQRFETILPELVSELHDLRHPIGETCTSKGEVAQRMWHACYPFRHTYITPMAAVAGAVAQALLPAYQRAGIRRAWINNGGDIALHLTPDTSVRVGLYANLAHLDTQQLQQGLRLDGSFDIHHNSTVRGVATSGWRGRSFSLGIADSVTVLAATAAQADAAASIIGNAVNVDAEGIKRVPACDLKDDSDLGAIPVTVHVPTLMPKQIQEALAAGLACAHTLVEQGLIAACAITCQGQAVRTTHTLGAGSTPAQLNSASFLTQDPLKISNHSLYQDAA